MKGVSLNLGFQVLGSSASLLTEYLRNAGEKVIDGKECQKLWLQVTEDYHAVIGAVQILANE